MWLARNSNGVLYLHEFRPKRVSIGQKGYWHSDGAKMPVSFKGVLTWQDEPMPVRLEADWVRRG